jgi:hypothetical protein
MTRRQWTVILVLVLLNYVVFNILVRQLVATSRPVAAAQGTTRATFSPTPSRDTATPRPTNTLVVQPNTATPVVPPTAETVLTATPTATTPPEQPAATATPRPTRRPRPPTATPTPSLQFVGEVIWDPNVAPNCDGPAVSNRSVIRDQAGNPVNGAQVEMNCYGNIWLSHPSGRPGEYDPGHYDFSLGQHQLQPWTCTLRVHSVGGVPVASSQVVTVQFDTNACQPGGSGHQVAIVNWKKQW